MTFKFIINQQKLLVSVLIISFLFSCKVSEINHGLGYSKQVNSLFKEQALNWLNSNKTSSVSQSNNKIDFLIANLKFNKLRTEEIRNEEKLLLIPISSKFKTEYNDDKAIANVLMLILTFDGKIRKGQIVQYQTSDNNFIKEFPINLLHNCYTFKDWNGKLSYYNIFNHLIYEIENRNNDLYSLAINTFKDELDTNNENNKDRRNWFLVTTYYKAGKIEKTVEKYMYTTSNQVERNQLFSVGDEIVTKN